MSGGRRALWTLYAYELRLLLRDRRTLVVSVLLPVVVLPLVFWASTWSERSRAERQAAETYRYTVVGPERELVRGLLAREPADGDGLRLEEVEVADAAAALDGREIDVFVEALPAADPGLAEASPVAGEAEVPRLRLVYRANRDASRTAADELEERLEAARAEGRRALLAERGLALPESAGAELELVDVARAEQIAGRLLGRYAGLFVLFFLLTGGTVVAADTLAGEKERGTLETLLTSAADRADIVLAKGLLILTVGVFIALVQLANLLLWVGLDLIEVPAALAVDPTPLQTAIVLLLLLPLAALVAATLLWASGRAATYKEFQVYFLPIFLGLLAPAAAAVLPGIELRSAVALVPIANVAVALREVLTGEIDLPLLAVAWVTTSAVAVAVARGSWRALSSERLISPPTATSAGAGPFERLERRAPAWFAIMWVTVLLATVQVPLLAELDAQLLFNLVVVFLGGSLALLLTSGAPPRRALALRLPPPIVWPLVLVGAPAFFVVSLALARLSGFLFPVPSEMLEEMTRLLLPAERPLWELLLLVAVLPAICEEIAFRGVLLHALHRRLRPLPLCLVVGVVFALFHMQLVRLLPTAVLGTLLAALTLLTGSLYPAMLWHALNNATAIVAERAGLPLDALDAWVYAVAAVVAAVVAALAWRFRTSYPGLRGS